MPSKKTARVSEKKRKRNSSIRSATRTIIGNASDIIRQGQIEEAEVAVVKALSALDGAAKKGIIHDNNADRRKSRLMTKLNALKNKT